MPRAVLILIAAVFLTAPSTAGAAGRGVPLPPEFTITDGACPNAGFGDVEGCAYPDGRIYLLPEAPDFTSWHEIGHVFDFKLLKGGDRAWFQRAFRVRGSWTDQEGDYPAYYDGQPAGTPDEIFADEYASCALGLNPSRVDEWVGGAGFEPTVKQHRKICAAIDRIGRRKGASH